MKSVSVKNKIVAGALTVLILAGGGLMLQRCANGEEYKSGLPVEKLIVETAAGKKAEFEVEVATKPIDLDIGLMYRKEMAKDHGMLFEFGPEPKEQSFWMKNTLIPLDMLFVGPDGRIVSIHHNAQPQDTTPIPSHGPITGVIEINGGLADDLGIKPGDKVVHPYFSAKK